MKNRKRQITIYATGEEQVMVERIKCFHQRNTDSDVLRFLISQEDKKILANIISNEITPRQEK